MTKVSFENHKNAHARAIGSMYVQQHETDAAECAGDHELYNVELMQSVLKPDSNFVDVGGYNGIFALVAGSIIKTGKIFVFEPVPTSVEIIRANVKEHNVTNATVIHAAISDVTMDHNHVHWREGAQCASTIFENPEDQNVLQVTEVQSYSLNYLAHTMFKGLPIHLLKVDVEGAEVELFRGSREFFRANPQCLVSLELHCHYIRPRIGQGSLNWFMDELWMLFDVMNYDFTPMKLEDYKKIANTGGANLLLKPR